MHTPCWRSTGNDNYIIVNFFDLNSLITKLSKRIEKSEPLLSKKMVGFLCYKRLYSDMAMTEPPINVPSWACKKQSMYIHIICYLRPLTRGKRFLLFLPDSHSAYYNSFVSAFGGSLPPSLGLSRICCTWTSFWWKRREGWGGWAHLATLGKMALGASV